MKLFIILATIAVSHGAKLENAYLPPTNARTAGGSGNFLQTPLSGPGNQNQAYNRIQGSGFTQQGDQFGNFGSFTKGDVNFASQGRPERPRASLDRNAAILRLDNNNDGETFSYAFETDNGIYAEESGVATNGVEAQGGYSYTGDDGQVYSVRYTADQNGFVPQGDHLPTPPPVPEEILKALEQNARDEAAGIYDDGSYNEGKYAQNYNGQFQNTNSYNGNDQDSVVTNAAYSGTPYNAPRNYNTGTFNANAGNTQFPTGDVNVANTRNSPVQRAYLPPFRGQNRSGPRRQGFNSRTGYNY